MNLRNLVALSTTSSHTDETVPSSKRVASGRARSASRDSCSSSLQRSASSPVNHKHSFGIQQQHIIYETPPLVRGMVLMFTIEPVIIADYSGRFTVFLVK